MKQKIRKKLKVSERKNSKAHEVTSYDASRNETATAQRVREINESSSEFARLKNAGGETKK